MARALFIDSVTKIIQQKWLLDLCHKPNIIGITSNGRRAWNLAKSSLASFVLGILIAEARERVRIEGDRQLGEKVLETVSSIA